ncbi:MAG: hypothetical protein HY908_03865 [Myxococcales bacterium]|nr:hypothetical protein [Myxococcales bacterium]
MTAPGFFVAPGSAPRRPRPAAACLPPDSAHRGGLVRPACVRHPVRATMTTATERNTPPDPTPSRTWGAGWRTPEAEARLSQSVDYCWRFFVAEAEVQRAVRKLVAILESEGIPYAIIGALALNEYGHRRVTVDIDLVMREEDLQAFKSRWLAKGYAERVPGTGKLIDTEFGVNVDVLSTGRFPGDDKPKPIAFPDPATTAIRGAPFALLPIERWIELKLASGMVARHRRKDLTDVQELIRSARLPRELADRLDPWVRAMFLELWQEVAEGEANDPY